MFSRVKAEVETLPFHDRVYAEKLLRELKVKFDLGVLARLLKLLERYGFRLNEEELDKLLLELKERFESKLVYR